MVLFVAQSSRLWVVGYIVPLVVFRSVLLLVIHLSCSQQCPTGCTGLCQPVAACVWIEQVMGHLILLCYKLLGQLSVPSYHVCWRLGWINSGLAMPTRNVCQKIIEKSSAPFSLGGEPIWNGISIGGNAPFS